MKKQWQKPELIVMVRSNPEEIVLAPCKGRDRGGPSTNQQWCLSPGETACGPPCNSIYGLT